MKDVPIDEERGLSVQVADDASDEEVEALTSRLTHKMREPDDAGTAAKPVSTKRSSGS